MKQIFCIWLLFFISPLQAEVVVGLERLFTPDYSQHLEGKKIGLVTNHTAVTRNLQWSVDLFKQHAKGHYKLVALFGPEHGLYGNSHAEEGVKDSVDAQGIPIYSLYGKTRRPTKEMLKGIDLLVYDMQDIGARSYTYISTLFYLMEEAAKTGTPVLVLDRPNPLGGELVDGPMLDEKYRSFVGYINVPYCHGMTVGELARYFNEEYKVGCKLTVIPMSGWKRSMTFKETRLPWIPTSPQIPTADTALYYPATGLLGELQMVNIGVGYTLPFRCVGAPWINGKQLAAALNKQNFPGVTFTPFVFTPFFGKFAKEDCEGVLIYVHNSSVYHPLATQYLILGTLKSLYPKEFRAALEASKDRQAMFDKVCGTGAVYQLVKNEKLIVWKLRELDQDKRAAFLKKRVPYLLYR